MRNISKLMVVMGAGGILLGVGLSEISSPVMQFRAAPDWRSRLQPRFSATPLQFADAGPQDLRPFGWTAGTPFAGGPPDYAVDGEIVDGNIAEEVEAMLADGAEQASHGASEAAAVLAEPGTVIDLPEPAPDLIPSPAAPAPAIVTFGVTGPSEYSFQ